jgi:transposase
LTRTDQELARAARTSRQAGQIAAYQTLHGVGLITAVTWVAELGDLTRFRRARELMGYVGVVSREASSGGRVRRGAITKTGNSHVRYVTVEAAWHYRHPPKVGAGGSTQVSKVLRARRKGQAAAIVQIAECAHLRLARRYRRLLSRGKLPQKTAVAVGRELLGFVWAIAHEYARLQQEVAAQEVAAQEVAAA